MSGAVPKLRFPGFAGEWKAATAGQLYEFRNGLNYTKDMAGDEVKVLGVGDFQDHEYFDDPAELQSIRIADELADRDTLQENDLLFVRSNGNKALIGRCLHIGPLTERIAFSGFTIRGRCISPEVAPSFGGRFFRSPKFREYLDEKGGGTNISNLSQAILSNFPLSVPTLPEQEKIAGFLGAVDGKISGLRRKEEGLKRFKAGLMQKLFSQELRFTRDDGSDFPEWEEKRLADLAHRPGEQFDPQREASRPRVIELEHLESGTGRILAAVEMDAQLSLKNRFRPGDVLFGKLRPYLRKFARPDFDGVCSSEIWVLRSRGEVSSAFLYLLVQSERFLEAANMSSGSKMPRAEWNAVANVEFPVPHPDEQRKIAEALSALDGKIAGVRGQIAGLETFKKGLLQQMFV